MLLAIVALGFCSMHAWRSNSHGQEVEKINWLCICGIGGDSFIEWAEGEQVEEETGAKPPETFADRLAKIREEKCEIIKNVNGTPQHRHANPPIDCASVALAYNAVLTPSNMPCLHRGSNAIYLPYLPEPGCAR